MARIRIKRRMNGAHANYVILPDGKSPTIPPLAGSGTAYANRANARQGNLCAFINKLFFMSKVITDKNKIDELLARGVEKVYPSRKALADKLQSGRRIRLYCGFDPSAPSLHIGNAIQINKLAQFQALGHEVIFLIGDFTGLIGDPTDKTATRKKLTREELLKNSKNYQKQASAYLNFSGDNPAKVLYNSQWGDKLTFKDLIEISSNFTLQQMINRDMFNKNLAVVKCRHCRHEFKSDIQFGSINNFKTSKLAGNTTVCPHCGKETPLDKEDIVIKKVDQLREMPIGFHELLYPIAQAYDSVAMDVDLEIGGNDQMFNMLCGRDLIKVMKKREKFVLTNKLLVDPSGKKMGKTEGNIVNLDETPENMYGQIMSWTDELIGLGFELCTKIPMDEVKKVYTQLKDDNVNPRDLKMKLAFQITKIIHGEAKAKKAQDIFVKTFQKKEIPDEIKMSLSPGITTTTDLVVCAGFVTSKSEARRLIKQKGIKFDGKVVNEIDKKIEIPEKGIIVQRGKRQFIKVIRK
jgi:tyrosyl-tRNA synthetase